MTRRAVLGRVGWLAAFAAAVGVLASGPWWLGDADLQNLIELFGLLALAQMWNLLAGYAGLVSIGQQAFIGIGGYALFVFADKAGIGPFSSIALAGLVAAALSLPAAALAFRLRAGYFAIGTWVIAEVVRLLVVNWRYVGGGDGESVYASIELDPTARLHGSYFWALGVAAASVLGTYLLLRTRLGLALTAIRDEETAARSVGVDVLRTRILVWVIAALGCGLVGAITAVRTFSVRPDAAFDVTQSAYMIFIVVIGGIGTIEGPIVGAIVFFALQQKFSQHGTWYLIAVGAVAVAAAVWIRGGIWGVVGRRLGLHLFPVQRRPRAPDATSPGTAPSPP
jgi:branched-chain amino acid transport system permease protein